MASTTAFATANDQRRDAAAARMAGQCVLALETLGDRCPERWRKAAEARIAWPQLSLTDLGQTLDPPQTKDVVASLLRRVTSYATRERHRAANR